MNSMHTPLRAELTPDDESQTLGDVMTRWPEAMPLLKALGIELSGNGDASLRVAAQRAGVPLAVVLAAVAHGATGGPR